MERANTVKLTNHKVGGWCLIVGGLLFALFWSKSLVDVEVPWIAALSVHGLSIVLLTIGLITFQLGTERASPLSRLRWASVVVAIVGLWTVLPLFPMGLALLGVILSIRRRWVTGALLAGGSAVFLAAYVFGTHIGDESASAARGQLVLVFAVGLVLIAAGLAALGFRRVQENAGIVTTL